MSIKYIIGIDYSISSPAFTILFSETDKFISYFFNSYKKKSFHNLHTDFFELPYPQEERFDRYIQLAKECLKIISMFPPEETIIGIEGYAFGAKGKVFHIAENCGILKYLLIDSGYQIIDEEKMSPNIIKKNATGKGNAKKKDMLEAFIKENGYNPLEIMTPDKSIESSFVADIVDSYFIAKYVKKITCNLSFN